MIVGILLIQAVAFAVLSGIVADRKKRNPIGWGLIGLVSGLFGFIAALVVEEGEPEKHSVSQSSSGRGFEPDEHEKKCPMCAEYIKLEARRCKHCGHEMPEEEVERQVEEVEMEVEERQSKRSPHGNRRSTTDEPREPSTKATMTILGAAVVIVLILAATVWAVAGAT